MNTKLFFLLLLTVFALSCGQSQTEIKGDIFFTRGNGQSLRFSAVTVKIVKKEKAANSEISIADTDYFATSDADGKFSVKIPNGEYTAAADVAGQDGYGDPVNYQWRVPFTANGGEKKLSLNNLNGQRKITLNKQ